jgi:hypothetical protein
MDIRFSIMYFTKLKTLEQDTKKGCLYLNKQPKSL